jgi:hypothetical protein
MLGASGTPEPLKFRHIRKTGIHKTRLSVGFVYMLSTGSNKCVQIAHKISKGSWVRACPCAGGHSPGAMPYAPCPFFASSNQRRNFRRIQPQERARLDRRLAAAEIPQKFLAYCSQPLTAAASAAAFPCLASAFRAFILSS